MVAIARALDISADVLILDEPTSSLDQDEVDQLFGVIRHLRSEGIAVVFISALPRAGLRDRRPHHRAVNAPARRGGTYGRPPAGRTRLEDAPPSGSGTRGPGTPPEEHAGRTRLEAGRQGRGGRAQGRDRAVRPCRHAGGDRGPGRPARLGTHRVGAAPLRRRPLGFGAHLLRRNGGDREDAARDNRERRRLLSREPSTEGPSKD